MRECLASLFAFYCCDKHDDQKQFGKEKVYSILQLSPVMKGSQVRGEPGLLTHSQPPLWPTCVEMVLFIHGQLSLPTPVSHQENA